ncbi:MAG: T9SS type A sorting domain-containing protein [Bacteroidaceae bacterium]|nr:T9SS type A sorting domain-containing protein [Bacteroidaceae bacterium]
MGESQLSVSLNPTRDTIRWKADERVDRLNLYDTRGTSVRYGTLGDDTIDLSGVASGTYILTAYTPSGAIAARVIKE